MGGGSGHINHQNQGYDVDRQYSQSAMAGSPSKHFAGSKYGSQGMETHGAFYAMVKPGQSSMSPAKIYKPRMGGAGQPQYNTVMMSQEGSQMGLLEEDGEQWEEMNELNTLVVL